MSRTLPNIGLKGDYTVGDDDWGPEMDANLLKLSTLVQGAVISRIAAVPGSPAEGDAYVLTAAPHDQNVAVYDDGAWVYFAPAEGWWFYDRDANKYISFDGAAWVEYVSGGGGGGGGGGDDALYRFGGFFTSEPGANEVVMRHVATDAFTVPADLDGSYVVVDGNPSATTELSVQLNGVEFATISIDNAGVVTLAGDETDVVAGDVVAVVAPADSNDLANVAFTFRAGTMMSGGGGGTRTTPTMVQMDTLRNDGTIALPVAPTDGNLMVFVAGGFGNSLPGYVPPGFSVFSIDGVPSANLVLIAFKRVESGDTGSYAISASDNQAAVLYEFSDAAGLAQIAGGALPFVNSTDFEIGMLEPFVDGVRLVAMTNDNAANFAIDAATGLTVDFYGDNTGGANHTSAFARLNPATFVDGKVTGDITGWSSAGYAYWVLFGPAS